MESSFPQKQESSCKPCIDRRSALAGTGPEDYGLSPGERLNEVITHSWNRLRRHYGEFDSAAAPSARRRGRHRPHQRQVEPAAAAGAGVRLPARLRRPGDRRPHLCHRAVLRSGAGAPRRAWPLARPPRGGAARRGGGQPARAGAGVPSTAVTRTCGRSSPTACGCGSSRAGSEARATAISGASSGCWSVHFRASPSSRARAGAWRCLRSAASSGARSPRRS